MNETEENKDLKLSILADLCLPLPPRNMKMCYCKSNNNLFLVKPRHYGRDKHDLPHPAKLVPAQQNGLKTPYNLISTKQCV
jgi:hypothetical protein